MPCARDDRSSRRSRRGRPTGALRRLGSGGRIRTCDLRVMSPTSYRTAPPRAVPSRKVVYASRPIRVKTGPVRRPRSRSSAGRRGRYHAMGHMQRPGHKRSIRRRARSVALPLSACLVAMALLFAVSGDPVVAEPAQIITATKQPKTTAELFKAADEAQKQIERLDEQLEITVEAVQRRPRPPRRDRRRAGRRPHRPAPPRVRAAASSRTTFGAAPGVDVQGRRLDVARRAARVGQLRRGREPDRLLPPSRSTGPARSRSSFVWLAGQVETLEARLTAKRDQALAIEEQIEGERLVIEDRLAEREALLKSLDARIAKILGARAELSAAEARRLAINVGDIRGTAVQVAVVSRDAEASRQALRLGRAPDPTASTARVS